MYHIFIGHSHLSGGEHDVNKLIAQRSYQKGLLTMGAVFEKFLENRDIIARRLLPIKGFFFFFSSPEKLRDCP